MSSEPGKLTAKQQAFVGWYVKLLNATRAAERAGYEGNEHTLEQVGYENLRKPDVRAAIDLKLKANIPSADEVLSLISTRATMDVCILSFFLLRYVTLHYTRLPPYHSTTKQSRAMQQRTAAHPCLLTHLVRHRT